MYIKFTISSRTGTINCNQEKMKVTISLSIEFIDKHIIVLQITANPSVTGYL